MLQSALKIATDTGYLYFQLSWEMNKDTERYILTQTFGANAEKINMYPVSGLLTVTATSLRERILI